MVTRVAEVVRRHKGPLPKSLDGSFGGVWGALIDLVKSKLSLSVRQLDALKVTIFLLTSLRRLKIKETKCNRANIVQNSNSLSLNFQLQAAPCSALGHTILWGEIMIKDIYILETLVWRNCHVNALDNLQRMFFLSSWYIWFGLCYCHPSIQAKYFKA